IAVHGAVLDLGFRDGALPAIGEAVRIDGDSGAPIIAEVQQHLGPTSVRAIALQDTAGLRRGVAAHPLGTPIRVPVGEAVLGRLLNAIGEPTDRGPPLPADIAR